MLVRTVNDGLAVKADDADRGRIDHLRREKVAHRFGVTLGDACLGLAQNAGPRLARVWVGRQILRGRQCCPQERAIVIAIGKGTGRSRHHVRRPIGLDHGDIDPVERRAAHQAKRADHPVLPHACACDLSL